MAKNRKETIAAYLFVSPAVLLFLCFMGIPMLVSFALIFFQYDIVKRPVFVGWDNIVRFFTDPDIPLVFGNTAKLMLPLVAIHSTLGLLFAYLVLNAGKWLMSTYRTVIYFPTIVTTTSVAVAWAFIFDTDLGVINYYLRLLGIENIPWLVSPGWTLPAIMLFSVWKFVGTPFLFYMIGLQNISKTYYEAAEMDGANSWKKFFHITLPMLTPTTFMVIVLSFINYLQLFDEPYVLTRGGPGMASTTVSLFIFRNFEAQRISYASTIATCLFLIIMAVTIIQFAFSKKWVQYGNE